MTVTAVLVPRDPYESAASLADALFGPLHYPRLRRVPSKPVGLAYGTISWPLAHLAAEIDAYYGDAPEILRDRTLVNFCKFGVKPSKWESFVNRALYGVSSKPTTCLRQPFSWRPRTRICPLCDRESWNSRGCHVLLWPHMAPLVEACWRHQVRLEPLMAARHPCRKPVAALPIECTYARNVVRLCELAAGPKALTAAYLVERLSATGFQRPDKNMRHTEFATLLDVYVRDLLSVSPYPAQRRCGGVGGWVLGFVHRPERQWIPGAYLALAMSFLESLTQDNAEHV
ncbi:hypothetical protein CBM2585_B50174 [Cupriavidus taiwanensis]|nr:hypothetical protein CBM2585_B50174 [Cupriavidus taiwanensis]